MSDQQDRFRLLKRGKEWTHCMYAYTRNISFKSKKRIPLCNQTIYAFKYRAIFGKMSRLVVLCYDLFLIISFSILDISTSL